MKKNIRRASMSRDEFAYAIIGAVAKIRQLPVEDQAHWDRMLRVILALDRVPLGTAKMQTFLAGAVADGLLTAGEVNALGAEEVEL